MTAKLWSAFGIPGSSNSMTVVASPGPSVTADAIVAANTKDVVANTALEITPLVTYPLVQTYIHKKVKIAQ